MASDDVPERDAAARGVPAPFYAMLCLPGGLVSGFVGVTLGNVLGRHGVSVAAVAGLVSLALLPTTWMFLVGPVIDVSLTPRRWYAIGVALVAACFVAFSVTGASAAVLPALGVLALAGATGGVTAGASVMAAMARTTTAGERGPIAGWTQTANLGGAGLGGGLGLWLATHVSLQAAALTLAAIVLAGALPMLMMRLPPRPAGASIPRRLAAMGSDVWRLALTRIGVLAILVNVLPAALGATAGLLPAAAGAWHASPDLVAVMRGALGGLTTAPGCVIGGYLCRRFRHRTVYMLGALTYAAGLAAMAVAPHTPFTFSAFVILNGVILGVTFGGLSSVTFDALDETSPATVGSALYSLSNVPLLAVTTLLGQAGARLGGVDGMLLTKSGLGVVSVAFYAAVAVLWRETPAAQPAMA
jgi:MFS family permease